MSPQELRPAYHRRMDLQRLTAIIEQHALPVQAFDAGREYQVRAAGGRILVNGRYEVVAMYLRGWIDAQADAVVAAIRTMRQVAP